MKGMELARALGWVDEDLLEEAIEFRPAGHRAKWKRYTGIAVAACLCLCVCLSLVYVGTTRGNSRTSASSASDERQLYELENLEDVERYYGNFPLLEDLTLGEDCPVRYTVEVGARGSLENSQDWRYLTAQTDYQGSLSDAGHDGFFCTISFQGDLGETSVDPEAFDRLLHLTGSTEGEFGGTEVEYSQLTARQIRDAGLELDGILDYNGFARFEYRGYTCYLETFSSDPAMLEETLDRILG